MDPWKAIFLRSTMMVLLLPGGFFFLYEAWRDTPMLIIQTRNGAKRSSSKAAERGNLSLNWYVQRSIAALPCAAATAIGLNIGLNSGDEGQTSESAGGVPVHADSIPLHQERLSAIPSAQAHPAPRCLSMLLRCI